MMSSKHGVRPIIKALVTVMTRVALTGGSHVIKAALNDVYGRTRGAGDPVWPASCAYRLIILHIIDEMFDVDLHHWTPVRGWKMACHQYTTASNSTTLESNKSVARFVLRPRLQSSVVPPYRPLTVEERQDAATGHEDDCWPYDPLKRNVRHLRAFFQGCIVEVFALAEGDVSWVAVSGRRQGVGLRSPLEVCSPWGMGLRLSQQAIKACFFAGIGTRPAAQRYASDASASPGGSNENGKLGGVAGVGCSGAPSTIATDVRPPAGVSAQRPWMRPSSCKPLMAWWGSAHKQMSQRRLTIAILSAPIAVATSAKLRRSARRITPVAASSRRCTSLHGIWS
jgi:hypothetical protein